MQTQDPVADLARELRLTADWLEGRAGCLEAIPVARTHKDTAAIELARLRGRAKYLRIRADLFAGPDTITPTLEAT